MDFLDTTINLLSDDKKKLSFKASIILCSFLLLIVVNNIFGFTFFYVANQKANTVKGINEVLKDSSLTSLERRKLIGIRESAINKEDMIDGIFDWAKSTLKLRNNSTKTPATLNYRRHIIENITAALLPVILAFVSIIAAIVVMTEKKDKYYLLSDHWTTTVIKELGILSVCFISGLILIEFSNFLRQFVNDMGWMIVINILTNFILGFAYYYAINYKPKN